MDLSLSKLEFIVRRIYDMAFPPAKYIPKIPPECSDFADDKFEPSLRNPVSQLCTANQFKEAEFRFWASEMQEPFRRHRKLWEFVFILQSLKKHDLLSPSRRGLGFGVGKEPLPAVMAKYGVEVPATDLDTATAATKGWVETNQHAHTLADLNARGICPMDSFSRLVRFEFEDMNNISESFRDFDFCWSSCAFEHLGSIEAGLVFVENSLNCLKPGGLAIHTTEYNCFSNERTAKVGGTVIFRMRDFLDLGKTLRKNGHDIRYNFNQGLDPIDQHVDAAPYSDDPHLKLSLMQYTTTSIGLLVRKCPS
jgi:SAM-dependent methyltransferase